MVRRTAESSLHSERTGRGTPFATWELVGYRFQSIFVAWLALSAAACTNTPLPSDRPPPMMESADAGTDWSDASDPDAAALPEDAAASMADSGSAPDAAMECPRVRITTVGLTLNVRPDPSTAGDPIGALDPGTVVTVVDVTHGEMVDGDDVWYGIETATLMGYVSGRFAECTMEEETFASMDGFYLPLECGMRVRISQGNNGTYSHRGNSAYAFDFSVPLNTPLHAIADGVVILVQDGTHPGDPCYDGGGPECATEANGVVVRHADGHASQYAHLNAVRVSEGDTIRRGTVVGLSGSTGYSTGPHAHVQLQEVCGWLSCQSVPLRFEDVPGDGVPETGDYVTSMNCP